MSNVYRPETLNETLYSNKKRTIWTPDGEFQVPMKKKKKQPKAWQAKVSDIWFKDEKGELILHDPVGEANTITNGAIWEMMQVLWGEAYAGTTSPSGLAPFSPPDYSSGNTGNYRSVSRSPYNDGSYNFPMITSMTSTYDGSNTWQGGPLTIAPWITLFGQLMFLNNSSGGLTGDHIPANVTFGTGFVNTVLNSPSSSISVPFNGWYGTQGTPIKPWGTTNTTLSDSFSSQASGTPTMSHSMVLSAASNAIPFTFDGIAWSPTIGYAKQTSVYSLGWWAAGVANSSAPTWSSANTTPTTVSNLQVSALWNPGYAITLNPGGSWGFTYSFQG